MAQIRIAKLVYIVAALALLALLTIDVLQLVKPSGLAAAACAGTLLRARPSGQEVAARYHDAIAAEAARADLPPELLAAVIVDHQIALTRFRAFTDCFGSAWGANLSLGLAQLRLSTAAQLDGKMLADLAPAEFRQLRARMLDDALNIKYAAKELRALLERRHRFPGMSAETLIHDPFAMALIITEYRMGRLGSDPERSKLSAAAIYTLRLIDDLTLTRFGRGVDDVSRTRMEIRAYLDHVYCERGIFDSHVCDEWRSSPAGKTVAR
jgi:hypothetical protein